MISQLIANGIRMIDAATIDQFIQMIDSTRDWFREWTDLKGLSHEMEIINFDKNLQNLA